MNQSGIWDNEPDKVQWVDAETNLDCLAVRNGMGAWCGYVGVPESHPWHGIDYGSCVMGENCDRDEKDWYCSHSPENLLTVHGGITYAAFCQDGPEEEAICHVVFDGRPDPIWWFGFDCAHGGDICPAYEFSFTTWCGQMSVYRDLEYVRSECARLAKQLAEVQS